MRSILIAVLAPLVVLAENARPLYPRWKYSNTTTTSSHKPSHKPPHETITVTTTKSLTYCPEKTKCHGQTITWTSTHGPLPCAPSITCVCVLPTSPPVVEHCPKNVTCTGQTTTYTSVHPGPIPSTKTYTVELPSSPPAPVHPPAESAPPPAHESAPPPVSSAPPPAVPAPTPSTSSRPPPLLSNDAVKQTAGFIPVLIIAGLAVFI